jgi:Kef-type K+ transport system membrane component KefB
MLETVAWLGILFFLLKTGLEIDFSSAWRQRGDALVISFTDIVVPMAIAFIPCFLLPDHYMVDPNRRFLFALFIATIMTISALPVTARILEDLKLYKTDVGFLIMSALSVNDILGWLIFTIIMSIFSGQAPEFGKLTLMIGFTLGFIVLCLTWGRSFSDFMIRTFRKKNVPEPGASLTFIALLGILCGAATLTIGIHALFGFFIAGVVAGEARSLSEKTRHVIAEMVHALFIPVFFATIGLKIDFFHNFDPFLVAFMILVGILGRFLGAWTGVSLSRQSRANRMLIAIAHTPGGEMQIVVGILALETGLITETVFVAIVFSAVFSCTLLGPWMAWALRRRSEVHVMDFFLPGGILPELAAETREDAIRELCLGAGRIEPLIDGEDAVRKVLARENEMGTGTGAGGAVPHARIEGLERPVVLMGRSRQGIEWDAPDGAPAHFVFLILTPPDDAGAQLQILRYLAMILQGADTRKNMLLAQDGANLKEILASACTSCMVKRRE